MGKRFTGVVIRATGSWYEVLHDGEAVRCRIRGRLRLKGIRSTNPVVVGDQVTCESDDGGDYVICDICPRRNYVIRRASNLSKESHIIAANIDQALLLATLRAPETATEFVDRFLVTLRGLQGARHDRTFESRSAGSVRHGGLPRRIRRCRIPRAGGFGHGRCRRQKRSANWLEGRVTLLSGEFGVRKIERS